MWIQPIDFDVGINQREARRGNRKLRSATHLIRIKFEHEAFGIEIANLCAVVYRIVACIKRFDRTYIRSAVEQAGPKLFTPCADRGDHADAGYCYSLHN